MGSIKGFKTVKISLAVVDDIAALNSKANSQLLEASSFVQKAIAAFSSANDTLATTEELTRKGLAMANELGATSTAKEIQGWAKFVSTSMSKSTKNINSLKSIS